MLSSQTHGDPFKDPVLQQAEIILAQRLTRSLVLDRDIFGEPGWDILLCAFIARRKGTDCALEEVARAIDSPPTITERWVNLLVEKNMLFFKENMFAITLETEQKLATMFKLQIDKALRSLPPVIGLHEQGGHRQA